MIDTIRFSSIETHKVDFLRGALAASFEGRHKASFEEVSTEDFSTVCMTVDLDDLSPEETNGLLIRAHRAVELLTEEELPWEVEIKEAVQ